MPVNDLVWRVGGWLLKDGRVVPTVGADEEAAFRRGAVKISPMGDYMEVAYWTTQGTNTRNLITSFVKENPPPSGTRLEFLSMAENALSPAMASRASLLNKKSVRKMQYGTPTGINPLLPTPSPEQQELDEVQEDTKEAGNVDNLEALKRPGQPGNPPNNTPAQVIHQPAYEKDSAGGTIMPIQPKGTPGAYMHDPALSGKTMPIAVPPTEEQGAPSWITGSKRGATSFPPEWTQQQHEREIMRAKSILRNPAATLEEKTYAERVLESSRELQRRASMLNKGFKLAEMPLIAQPGERGPREEAAARKKANNDLAILSRKYHHGMPIQEIKDILQKYGFNPEVMDGIYTGEEGKIHEQTGPRTWIAMTWHKLPRTGLWEIVAYLS